MGTSTTAWIDLLSRYGPAALLVFVVVVLFRMARATSGLSNEQKKIQTRALAALWVTVFVLALLIVVAWWQGNFPKEFIVQGTISNLTYPQTITSDQIFFRRDWVSYPDFQYDWRIINPERLTSKLELALQKGSGSTKDGTLLLKYKLQIREDFYKGRVEIEYHPETDIMTLRHGDYTEDIKPTISIAVETAIPAKGIDNVVFASARREPKPEELIRGLDVDDALARASAKQDLVALGAKAIPQLDRALVDTDSYRLKVGILSVLKEMGSSNQSLNESSRCTIAELSKDPDPILSQEARGVIATGLAMPKACPDKASGTAVKLGKPVAIDSGRPPLLYVGSQTGVVTVLREAHNGLTAQRQFLLPGVAVLLDLAASAELDRVFVCYVQPSFERSFIAQYSPDGTMLKNWYLDRQCNGLAYDPKEEAVYFSVTHTGEIFKIALADGNQSFVGEIGGAHDLGAIAVDIAKNRIYAADQDTDTAYEYNLLTHRSRSIVSQREDISALRLDPGKGLLYMADKGRKCIVSVRTDVDPPAPGPCSRNPSFRTLSGLAMTEGGTLSASDSSADAIFKLSPDGHILSKYP